MALSRILTEAERRAHNNRDPKQIVCDHFGCRNVAVEVVGFVRELNRKFVACAEHLNSRGIQGKISV